MTNTPPGNCGHRRSDTKETLVRSDSSGRASGTTVKQIRSMRHSEWPPVILELRVSQQSPSTHVHGTDKGLSQAVMSRGVRRTE
jgi:RNA:NAD 2'-phosphotransferase (TPT1/KptA family)